MEATQNGESHSQTNGDKVSPKDPGATSVPNENAGAAKFSKEVLPSWKKQIKETKIKKEKERRMEELEEQRRKTSSEVPEWKKAIISKRQELMMTSDDPYMICKRRIQVLTKECKDPTLPPWKQEVLQRKMEKLKEDLAQLEEDRHRESVKADR